jgi:CDGSH-type Zn-finger protein
MLEPKIAKKGPYVIKEQPGEVYWCSCGYSKKQPYCDGSHNGTDFLPIKVIVKNEGEVAWCGCKQSSNKPYCDGAHSKL